MTSHRGVTWFLLAACALVGGACSPNIKTAIGPNNSHVITCGNGMSSCVTKAAKICGEDGYTVLEGVSRPKRLGGSSSSYQTMSELAELTVRCGLPEDVEEEETEIIYKLPERTDEPVEVPDAPPRAPATACTPGSTLACVGPGACQGGQICLESGQGYGPCDCGAGQSDAPAESNRAPSESGQQEPSTIKGSGGGPGASEPVVPGAAPAPTPLTK